VTLLRTPTIPSEFIRLDSTVSDADAPVNVRDEQVKRENYNILLARRVRHPLVTEVFRGVGWDIDEYGDDTDLTNGQIFKHFAYSVPIGDRPVDTLSFVGAAMIATWKVRVPPFCRELTVRIRAKMTTASGDAAVFPIGCVGPPANYDVTVTGTSYDEYEVDIPVSDGSKSAFNHVIGLSYVCEAYDGAQGANTVAWAENISTIPARAYVVGTDVISGEVGDVIYFTTPSNTIQPRAIVALETITVDGTTYQKVWVDKPWDVLPVAGNVYNTEAVAGLVVHSVTIVPKATTDFGETSGVV